MQIGPVGDAVGRAELFLKTCAEWNPLQNFSRNTVADMDFSGCRAMGGHRIPGTEPLQGADRIGGQLQARTYGIKSWGFFEDVGGFADACQAQGRGKAGNSAASNEKL